MSEQTTPPPVDGAEAAQTDAGKEEKFDGEYVRALRKEAAQYRTQNKELAAKVAGFEAERQTEAERLAAQTKVAQEAAAAAQAELRKARVDAALARAAAKVGVDVNLVSRLVDVELDADGQPLGVEAALSKVLDAYPQLKPQVVSPGATNPSRGSGSKLTMEDVKKMTPEQINARWDEVKVAMGATRG